MAYVYRSDHSTSSAQSTEPVPIGENSRSRSLSSTDRFHVSQNRTRIPSVYMPHHEFRGIQTAADLLAAESSSHPAGRYSNDTMSRNIGPASSASRDEGDPTTLRIQRDEIAVERPNADGRGTISNVGGRVEDRGRADLSEPSGSGSSVSEGISRAISTGSVTTSNRDFSGSSSGSQGEVATKALKQYNTYASQHGLSLLEDEATASEPEKHSHRPLHSRGSRFLRKSGSRAQLALSNITNALKRASSKSNLQKDNLKGKTIEELGKGGVSVIRLREGFSAGELFVPTFLCNLMTYIEKSEKKHSIFRLSGDKTVEKELLRYFASHLPRADDESKFDQGAASTSLPKHIKYGVMDVACVLKTITCGLPCGVLGSLSLFYAVASIYRKSEDQHCNCNVLQVQLIALAIASVKSTLRKSFLIAFLGLGSTIGHDTDVARNKESLMTFSALGPVLGPSLIGERAQDIDLNFQSPGLTETAPSVANKYKFVSAITIMLISLWPMIVQELQAIEKGEFPNLHRNPTRLPRVLEDAELDDHPEITSATPLQHEHRVDRRVFNLSQATSSSQGATSSSSGGSVRHNSGPSIGHRQPLPHPYHSHPQEESEQGLTDHQYFSAQSNEPNVQPGNERGPASSSRTSGLRDQLDGQSNDSREGRDTRRWERANISSTWYAPFLSHDEVPWAQEAQEPTEQREGSSLEGGGTGLTGPSGSRVQEADMTHPMRRGSVGEPAQRSETAERVAAPIVNNTTTSAAPSSLADALFTSFAGAARRMSQRPPIPSAREFIGEHFMRRTEELLVLHAARLPPPTSALTTIGARVFEEDDELNRAATLRAQHEYATRAVLVWEIEAADRRAAVEANQ
ncbi:hypothetical protein MMC22_009139 [Lobaria immixta]|nr:hypothetical protein [Lobaria immixta]